MKMCPVLSLTIFPCFIVAQIHFAILLAKNLDVFKTVGANSLNNDNNNK